MNEIPKLVREFLARIGAKGGAASLGVSTPAKRRSGRINARKATAARIAAAAKRRAEREKEEKT
jgi:hypothetical protein